MNKILKRRSKRKKQSVKDNTIQTRLNSRKTQEKEHFSKMPGVLSKNAKIKFTEYPNKQASSHIYELWRCRGYNPIQVGCAKVRFQKSLFKGLPPPRTTYVYPLWFNRK